MSKPYMMSNTDVFVELPDGTFELMPNGVSCDPKDIYPIDIHPHVKEAVEFSISDQRDIDRYVSLRRAGHSRNVAFIRAARCAYFREPLQDSGTITFLRLDMTSDFHKVSNRFDQQVTYWRMLHNGESHKMAEMLATRSFPGVKTDSIFNEGKFSTDRGKVGAEELWLREQAESRGVSTTGKWYCKGLSSFPGDPTAWVDSRHDVIRIAAEKNMTVHGYVEHKGHEADPGHDVEIADSIIEDEVADIMESNPFANVDQVRDEVYQLRTGAVDSNPLRVGDYHQSDIDALAS